MKIDIILPVNNPKILKTSDLAKLKLPHDVFCEITLPKNTLIEICNADDEEIAKESIIACALEAANKKADAIIVYCFGEPGVDDIREKTTVPVLGIAAPSMHLATVLGKKFSVVASLQAHCPLIEQLAKKFGLNKQMGAPISVDIPPSQLMDNDLLLSSTLLEKVQKSTETEKIEALILGCGSLQSKSQMIHEAIKKKLGYDLLVLDPLPVALYTALTILNSK